MATKHSEKDSSRFVQLPGVRLHYNEVGSGSPVIFLHGAGPGANSWSNFSQNIDAFAASQRVLLVDLPQFGKSEKVSIDEPRLSYGARVMRDFMDALEIDKAHFVGNSFGGQVAIKVAIDSPGRVLSLAAIGSAPVVHSIFTPMPVEGVKMMATYYREDGGPSLAKMRKYLQTMLYNQDLVTEELIRTRHEASIDPEVIRMNTGPVAPRQDLTAEFAKVKAPALIIWGMDDRFGALDIGLLMTRTFQNARMHIFAHCGHWAQVEYADECNELMLSFFRRNAQ
jgi:4,5:9,10-diseco-3-hydroxy-5,9,17-trioxoandrosta-1(10),2-diene-4-oate hydrolase